MRTVFISSFHGLISRNILGSGVLSMLGDTKIIILCPDFKKKYFIDNFSGPNVFVEGVQNKIAKKDRVFQELALALLNTGSLWVKKRSQLAADKNLLKFLFYTVPSYIFGRSGLFLNLFRYLDRKSANPEAYSALFLKYNPDLIFATDLQSEFDVQLLQAARKHKIKTVGMIRSWDNPAAKGALRFIPDKILVNNEIIKKEISLYSKVSEDLVDIIGIPHYDRYFKYEPGTKEALFRKFSLDPSKKMVLFAPFGNRYLNERNKDADKKALESLSENDLNILVRCPPSDTVNFDGFTSHRANVAFDLTGIRTWKHVVVVGGSKVNEVSREDDERLVESIKSADLVVSGASTVAVDAAFFNKPVVLYSFDGETNLPLYRSVRRYYDYNHWGPVLKSGGVKLAKNPEEFELFVRGYLEDPSLDAEGRKKIAEEQCWKLDGKSAERLAMALLARMKQ